MLKDLPLSEHIHQHCNESMERALLAERHPLWARSCPELKDIDFIRLGLLRCISVVDSGRHFLQTNEQIYGQLLPHSTAVSPGRADSLQKAQGNLPIRSAR
ncbi:hypothetical protein [Bathymodiolus japonicus methanotrophic gill symbiont]|uniref:hypothetical protein n=1 Tax=Bathymodiolus japonicus methanotrophic gill symbiont TaxID=113269 RepID=UPI001C8EF53E|nr:hypothetical protein [Bathymodiolus japonicus methanotrophic gill symbiont]